MNAQLVCRRCEHQGIVLTHAQRRAKGSATEAERLGHRRTT